MTEPIETCFKDGVAWPIAGQAEVDWITEGTEAGRRITAAIPPLFADYATLTNAAEEDGRRDLTRERRQDLAFVEVLRRHSADRPWWIGYLDTGADDIVFPGAPIVTLYEGWHYVLVEAGPEQAATWRQSGDLSFWKGALPNLMFPADSSWLVSTLWDDDWTCIGGPAGLVDRFLRHPDLEARPVTLGEDATPPGHQAI